MNREHSTAPATGIAYLHLVADAHHQQVAAEERIGFHALYSTVDTDPGQPPGQLPGQLSIDDALAEDVDAADAADAVAEQPQARA